MMFPKSSVNKKSASFDFKQAFKTNSIIGIAAFLLTAYEFVIKILDDFSIYINDAFSDLMSEIPASALSIISNAEYIEKFRKNTIIGAAFTGQEAVYNIVIICAVIGAMFALCFAYSMKKKNVNFYYSIPIDRATMFKNRVTTAIIWIAVVFAVPIFFDLLINIRFLGYSLYLVKLALALFAECFIYTMASFVICTIGVVSCYTVIEGIFFAGTLYTFPTALMIVLDFLCNGFLRGYNRSTIISDIFSLSSSSEYFGDKSFLLITSICNPLLLGTKLKANFYSDNIITLCNNHGSYDNDKIIIKYTLPDMSYIIPLLIWAVLIVAGFFLANYIFTHKKMENASIHATNRFATGFFALQFSLCIAGFFAVMKINSVNHKLTQFIAFAVMFVVIVAVYYITVSICKRKAFHDVKTYVTPLITGGVIGIVCLVLGTGLFGYADVPAVDKVEYAAITADGMVDATYADTEKGMFPFRNYYSENIIGVFSDKEDIEKFLKVADAVSSCNGNMENCSITIAYKLKDGKTIKRKFNTADKNAIYELLSLTDTKEYKENLNNFILKDGQSNIKSLEEKAKIFDAEADVFGGNFWSTSPGTASLIDYDTVQVFSKGTKIFDIKNSEELRKALAEDLAEMTFEQRFKPTEKEICTLSFVQPADYEAEEVWDGKVLDYEYADTQMSGLICSYDVYPSMKNTVAFLNTLDEDKKAKLFSEKFTFDNLNISKAIVTTPESYYATGNYTRVFSGNDSEYYDYYLENGFIKTKTEITDKSKMAKLYELGKGKWYVQNDDVLVLLLTGKRNDAQEAQCIALIIPKEDIPSWLKAQIK